MTDPGRTPMVHSEAHERLADLALEPAELEGLARAVLDAGVARAADSLDVDPGRLGLVAHLRACPDCRDELAAWRRVHGLVADVLADPARPVPLAELAAGPAVAAPASLRAAVAGLVAGPGPAPAPGPAAAPAGPSSSAGGRRARSVVAVRRWLPLAAVIAIVVAGGGLVVDRSNELDAARSQVAAMASVTAAVDRVLRDPGHRVADLTSAAGEVEGSVSWSSHDVVILTTALAPPPGAEVYRCWVERGGTRSEVGEMLFAGSTGYWAATLDSWATTSFGAGATFGISLEPRSGGVSGPAILVANLGS